MYNVYHDYVVVGSGAGGATIARELARNGKDVLVIEQGFYQQKLGSFINALRYFDINKITKIPRKSQEGNILYRAIMAGGTTVVSAGNMVRSLEKELAIYGINLSQEFAEAEKEMNVGPVAEKLISEGGQSIALAARQLGYRMNLMPKAINPDKCKRCGQCVLGCRYGAKWTALDYLQEAEEKGAKIIYNTNVQRVIVNNGKANGIIGKNSEGEIKISAKIVLIAAGGLGTPVILQNSGIKEAGSNLFMDFHVHTYGVTKKLNLLHEPQMSMVNLDFLASKGFLLSPFVNHPRPIRFIESGAKGFTMPTTKTLGIMTKISDDSAGLVSGNGSVSKPVTERDWQKIRAGTAIAKKILIQAGADASTFVDSKIAGSHSGGTAAIGKVVDHNLQTKVDNLFVCDSSVLPVSTGLPPILTIVALAKRLSKLLTI